MPKDSRNRRDRGFEVALFSWGREIRCLSCFPHSGDRMAEALSDLLEKSGIAREPYVAQQSDTPIIINWRDGQWLVVRSFVEGGAIVPVLDLGSDRWRDSGLDNIDCCRVTLTDDGEYDVEQGTWRTVLESNDSPDAVCVLNRLTYCLRDASRQALTGCLEALCYFMGCGLELQWSNDTDITERIPICAAATVAAYMMLLCRRYGSRRKLDVEARPFGDWLALSCDFELYEPFDFAEEVAEGLQEYAARHSIEDKYPVRLDVWTEAGHIRVRAYLGSAEAAYLGIKLPAELEYDPD